MSSSHGASHGGRGGDESEPDPRFTLANERTFLTWLSTSLALSAAGVAMAAVPQQVFMPWMRTLLAVLLVLLAALAAGMAYPRWRRVQRALRRGEPLPDPAIAPLLGYGVALVAVLALVLILLGP
jgi:Predicted membrane protein